MNEKETGISYARLAEIATRLKDMLTDEGYTGTQIISYLEEEYDLDLNGRETIFFQLFYDEDDEENDINLNPEHFICEGRE